MKYIVESGKSFEDALNSLNETVPKHKFGILHEHNIKATLNGKGVPFEKEVRVLEVCNPQKASAVLNADMALNMVLPCRISVWEDAGQVKLGTILPTALLASLNDSPELRAAAEEVEQALIAIIDEAK
ncbi:MAG: DUF302 domain-containing protein [Deltaproteobacteria bacterium]|nr:DUF302 domain-containing protein [Deltaproteobacteria bacterium]